MHLTSVTVRPSPEMEVLVLNTVQNIAAWGVGKKYIFESHLSFIGTLRTQERRPCHAATRMDKHKQGQIQTRFTSFQSE